MYRRVSINISAKTMLDSKRSTEIKSSLPQLSRQSVDVFNTILAETQNRLSVRVDVETKKRLLQRLTDIQSATQFFLDHSEIELIGIYGWGDSCQIKTDPGQGISQFDSIIYRKNRKVYVEKIGSCWQIFSSLSIDGAPKRSTAVKPITSDGEVFAISPIRSKTPSTFQPSLGYCMTSEEMANMFATFPAPSGCVNPLCTDIACTDVPTDLQNGNKYAHQAKPRRKKIQRKCTDTSCQDSNCTREETAPLISRDDHPKSALEINIQEGCPCCVNAIDLDELAGVGKFINTNQDLSSASEFDLITPDSSWGLTAGIAAPFAGIGLVAAYRNITGGNETRRKLLKKLQEVELLIRENPTPQRIAYRDCLQYSLFDANWNIAVPGALNGTSSAAVISTLIISSPIAIPAIGAYAAAQTGRGVYDSFRTWNRYTGHAKIDQITRSKRYFYVSNTSAFGLMTAGAVLIAVSPLTFGATLIPGLCLLIPGTIASGVLNNIWPRKFRPRNGDIGIDRDNLTAEQCANMIQKIREEKLKIKTFKAAHLKSSTWTKTQRVLAKMTAVLPFGQRRATRWLHLITQKEISNSMPSLALHKDTLFADLDPAVTPTEISEVITTHIKSLRYQQYGLTDYYWALDRVPISN